MKKVHRNPARGILFLLMSIAMTTTGVVFGETTITPSITLTERYDTNVLFVSGKKLDDFVTTVAPLARVEHEDRYVKGSVAAGVMTYVYAKNPGLNYVGANGGVSVDLGPALARVVHGFSLKLTDAFMYTPETPAFLTSISQGSEAPPSLVNGMQAARANSFSNRGAADARLPLSQTVSWQASYINQHMRFGTAQAAPVLGGFFNTTFQSVNTGPQWQVSPNDTVSLTYQYLNTEFSRPGGGGGGFQTNGGLLGWTRVLSPTLTASVTVGLTAFQSGKVQDLENASLEWVSGQDEVLVRFSRSVMPSFYIASTALVSNMLIVSGTHRFTEQISGGAMVNYAKNESVPAGFLEYNSFSFGPRMMYDVSSNVSVSLSYVHSQYETKFASNSNRFERDMAMVTLHGEWK